MFGRINIQVVTALTKLPRLKGEDGLLLAVYPDFILAVRPGMDKAEQDAAADALLTAAEGLSLPVMETPMNEDENEDSLVIHPDMLEEAGFLGLDYDEDLIYTVENGRIIIETEDE